MRSALATLAAATLWAFDLCLAPSTTLVAARLLRLLSIVPLVPRPLVVAPAPVLAITALRVAAFVATCIATAIAAVTAPVMARIAIAAASAVVAVAAMAVALTLGRVRTDRRRFRLGSALVTGDPAPGAYEHVVAGAVQRRRG